MENQSGNISVFDGYIGRYLDAQERIQKLFGVANMDEFLKMDEAALIANFMKLQKQAFHSSTPSVTDPASIANESPESTQSEAEKVDYALLDNMLKEEAEKEQAILEEKLKHDRKFIPNGKKRGYVLTIAVRQNDAYAFAPCYENTPPVFEKLSIRTRISTFFRQFLKYIDNQSSSTSKLSSLYDHGSLYFNAWGTSDIKDIYQFAYEKCSKDLPVREIEQTAYDNVYKKIEVLYDIWHLPTTVIEAPVTETEAKRRATIRAKKEATKENAASKDKHNPHSHTTLSKASASEALMEDSSQTSSTEIGKRQIVKFNSTVSNVEFNQTVSIMIQLLPLTTGRNLIKHQETYDAEKATVKNIFESCYPKIITYPTPCTPNTVKQIVFPPDTSCKEIKNSSASAENGAEDAQNGKLIKSMNDAIESIRNFPEAQKALQDYLDDWNQEIFNVLIGGTIEYARELNSRLAKEKDFILSNLLKEYPDQRDYIEKNLDPTELEESAINAIENRCIYPQRQDPYHPQHHGMV